jgi:hypothetical protein
MTKEEFYDRGIVKINEVYQIFKDHFTEDRVDLRNILPKERFCNKCIDQGNDSYTVNDGDSPYIIVHFPVVTITNEFDDSVTIKDLWAKIFLTYKGTMKCGFLLNRSHYPISHWNSDYMHSHIPGIPKNRISDFLSPCLGSGPIRDTISSLISGYDELLWQLFCRELEVYVTVESIAGVPYRRLKNIGQSDYRRTLIPRGCFCNYCHYNYNNHAMFKSLLKKFIKHLIDNRCLRFNFNGTSYSIAMSPLDYYINISNIFIEWYNEKFNNKEITIPYSELIARNVIFKVDIIDNIIYYSSTPQTNRNERGGGIVLTFKDKPVNLVIEDDSNEVIESSHILNPNITTAILRSILAIINYKYGREENRNTEGTDNTSNTQYRIIL